MIQRSPLDRLPPYGNGLVSEGGCIMRMPKSQNWTGQKSTKKPSAASNALACSPSGKCRFRPALGGNAVAGLKNVSVYVGGQSSTSFDR
jgi:hypothetical protein